MYFQIYTNVLSLEMIKKDKDSRTACNNLLSLVYSRHFPYQNSPILGIEELPKVQLETNIVWYISYKNKTTRRFKHCKEAWRVLVVQRYEHF